MPKYYDTDVEKTEEELNTVDLTKATTNVFDRFDGNSIFPFGQKHRGKTFNDVPVDYYKWFYENVAVYHPRSVNAKIIEYIKVRFQSCTASGSWQRRKNLGPP